MITVANLSQESVNLLKMRGQSDRQVTDFAALLADANQRLAQNVSAKEILSGMTHEELNLVQTSVGLVDDIDFRSLSNEGAMNLFAQPDKTGLVDLNNDGLVEIGIGKIITFPPVNAPASVQRAWDSATEGMSEKDKLMMELQMHGAVYGIHIDGVATKQALSPDTQWRDTEITKLFESLRSSLEFSVSLDGWDRYKLVQKEFYDNFENALQESTLKIEEAEQLPDETNLNS